MAINRYYWIMVIGWLLILLRWLIRCFCQALTIIKLIFFLVIYSDVFAMISIKHQCILQRMHSRRISVRKPAWADTLPEGHLQKYPFTTPPIWRSILFEKNEVGNEGGRTLNAVAPEHAEAQRHICAGHDRRLTQTLGCEGGLKPDETLQVMVARRNELPIWGIPKGDSLCSDYSEFQLGHSSLLLAMHLAIPGQIALDEWDHLFRDRRLAYGAMEWVYIAF